MPRLPVMADSPLKNWFPRSDFSDSAMHGFVEHILIPASKGNQSIPAEFISGLTSSRKESAKMRQPSALTEDPEWHPALSVHSAGMPLRCRRICTRRIVRQLNLDIPPSRESRRTGRGEGASYRREVTTCRIAVSADRCNDTDKTMPSTDRRSPCRRTGCPPRRPEPKILLSSS
jgi:hypothetical protein